MTDRIIRDIRFYELRPENYEGQFDGILGNVYKKTPDTKHIGERIARKLNELNFVSGIFDHIYIYLSPSLPESEMTVQGTEYDERLKSVHFGIKPSVFNSLSESEKDKWTKEVAFKVLYFLFHSNSVKTQLIAEVEVLINTYNKEIEIHYKAKETKEYKIELGYQIKPNENQAIITVKYLDKKENVKKHGSINLLHYEDIYSLVDTIAVKDNVIVLNPKKTNVAKLLGEKYYQTPLTIEIAKLEN